MTIQHLHVDGFGKLVDLDLTLSDGINVFYGDNEAGKSTLCSFIFHMLFGMERSRGKASGFDTYIHYLPWHSSAYGGSLTFESDGSVWFLERSFLSDSRYTRLTCLDDGTIFSQAENQLARLLSGVSKASYRTLFWISQSSLANNSALTDILQQYTQNLPGSGSLSLSPTKAIKLLKRQKKELASQLSGTSSATLYQLEDELTEVHKRLEQLSSDTSDDTLEEEPDDAQEFFFVSCTVIPLRLRLLCLSAIALLSLGIYLLFSSPVIVADSMITLASAAICLIAGLVLMLIASLKLHHWRHGSAAASQIPDKTGEKDHFSEEYLPAPSADLLSLQQRSEALQQQKVLLLKQLDTDAAIKRRIDAVQLAMERISTLSAEIHHSVSPELQRSFARHASALTGRSFSQIILDESFHFHLVEEGHLVPLEALSRGTVTQLFFACRLASAQLLYPGHTVPLLLDDVFALTDDARLSSLLSRLCMDYPGQKLIFSCQKREAATLSQHSLPYHLIRF